MTTPSPFDGSEPTRPPSPADDEEALPPAGADRTGGELPLVRQVAEPAAPGGASFAESFARRHYFSGARLLMPGRRVAVAVAGVTGLAVVGVGVAAGVSRLGGDDTVQAAVTVRSTAGASAPLTHRPSASSGPASHRPSAPPKSRATGKGGGAPAAGGAPALPPQGGGAPVAGAQSGGGGGTPAAAAQGTGSGTSGTVQKPAPPPPKATTAPVVFTGKLLFNFAASRCLATQHRSRAAGTQTVLADCDSSDPSQGWTFRSDGTARDFGGTMCLDVSNPGDYAPVRVAKCSASRAANQRFVLKTSYDLVDVAPDLCVDAKDKNTAAGTVLQLWTCAGTANQKWRTV
ncbi:RICIN domain-containing protein [Streptomyces sp. V4-01]|uniref:RICIN domain-containing protein n=1 Tax=Actinacidiphila polyblastidii TaxID=3110430 RepID=A0ABU7PBG4_9ACTN|nr:RICIN domain-containing protein [Streptomyces sp. V4-01]